jgi:hypothetical protein
VKSQSASVDGFFGIGLDNGINYMIKHILPKQV